MVEFLVVSETLSTAEMLDSLGAADLLIEPTARFPTQSSWVIHRSSDGDTPIDELVEAVLARVARVRAEIAALRSSGATTVLRVTAYIGPGEATEPGFGLDSEGVQLLAEVGAFLDGDLYYSGPDGP